MGLGVPYGRPTQNNDLATTAICLSAPVPDGLGISSIYDGYISAGAWHRIAAAFDLTGTGLAGAHQIH